MILAAMISLSVLGQRPLPGSTLTLERAKEEALYIVVARVGKTFGVISSPEWGVLLWTELNPSAVLKGEVTGEELNTYPLDIQAHGAERLPKTGDELVFFIKDRREIIMDQRRDIVISKVLPKTEAILTAIRAETVARPLMPERFRPDPGLLPGGGGIGGGGGLGGSRPFTKPEAPPPYQGTKIVPDRKAAGDTLKLQNEFAAAMSRADPQPEDRRAHFSWLDKDECIRRYRVLRLGWYGSVIGWEPRPGGGWLVKIAIHPWLHSMRFRHGLFDSVEETYEFVGGRVRLIHSNAATARPGNRIFPAAL